MVVLGHTGMGKSALCNLLSGHDEYSTAPFFSPQRTQNTSIIQERWMGHGEEYVLLDTPGNHLLTHFHFICHLVHSHLS